MSHRSKSIGVLPPDWLFYQLAFKTKLDQVFSDIKARFHNIDSHNNHYSSIIITYFKLWFAQLIGKYWTQPNPNLVFMICTPRAVSCGQNRSNDRYPPWTSKTRSGKRGKPVGHCARLHKERSRSSTFVCVGLARPRICSKQPSTQRRPNVERQSYFSPGNVKTCSKCPL